MSTNIVNFPTSIIVNALNGVCNNCNKTMPKISRSELNERLSECEDDIFECEDCVIEYLVCSGWDAEYFQKMTPEVNQEKVKLFIEKCQLFIGETRSNIVEVK